MSDATPTPEPTTDDAETVEASAPIGFPDRAPRTATPRSVDREPAEDDDDYVTADERLEKFWRKHKNDDVSISTTPERFERAPGDWGYAPGVEWTVTAKIHVIGDDAPDRTFVASATRSTADPNPVVASRPLETASTAALSRALRYAGFGLAKRPAKQKTA